LALGVCLVVVSCASGHGTDNAKRNSTAPTVTAPVRVPSTEPGPSIALDTEQVFADGLAKAELVVVLRQLPVPPRDQHGAVVLFHPTADPVEVSVVGGLPVGGTLEVCRTDDAGVRRDAGCEVITEASGTARIVFPGAPDAHVGTELAGTWKRRITVDEVRIRYRNVDYFLQHDVRRHNRVRTSGYHSSRTQY
jgi:hypothetical protein